MYQTPFDNFFASAELLSSLSLLGHLRGRAFRIVCGRYEQAHPIRDRGRHDRAGRFLPTGTVVLFFHSYYLSLKVYWEIRYGKIVNAEIDFRNMIAFEIGELFISTVFHISSFTNNRQPNTILCETY